MGRRRRPGLVAGRRYVVLEAGLSPGVPPGCQHGQPGPEARAWPGQAAWCGRRARCRTACHSAGRGGYTACRSGGWRTSGLCPRGLPVVLASTHASSGPVCRAVRACGGGTAAPTWQPPGYQPGHGLPGPEARAWPGWLSSTGGCGHQLWYWPRPATASQGRRPRAWPGQAWPVLQLGPRRRARPLCASRPCQAAPRAGARLPSWPARPAGYADPYCGRRG